MNISKFWDSFLSKKENFKLMERTVKAALRKSSINQQDIIEDAISYVSEELLKNDKKRLQAYNPAKDQNRDGKAFFYFTVCRIVRDYKTYKFSRYRRPKSLMDNSDFLIILVYDLLYKQKLSADEVVEQLKDAGKEPELVKEALQIVRDTYKDRDGQKFRQIPIENIDLIPMQNQKVFLPASEDQFDILMIKQLKYLLSIVFKERIMDEIPDDHMLPRRIRKLAAELNDKFQVSETERKFLRLVYLDGMKVGVAGKNVGWNNSAAKEKHRQLKRKLRRIFPKSTLREFISCFEKQQTYPVEIIGILIGLE